MSVPPACLPACLPEHLPFTLYPPARLPASPARPPPHCSWLRPLVLFDMHGPPRRPAPAPLGELPHRRPGRPGGLPQGPARGPLGGRGAAAAGGRAQVGGAGVRMAGARVWQA